MNECADHRCVLANNASVVHPSEPSKSSKSSSQALANQSKSQSINQCHLPRACGLWLVGWAGWSK
jgi:hypothetical protein